MPSLDSSLQPCAILSKAIHEPGTVAFGAGKIIWAPTEALTATLAQHFPSPTIRWDAPQVEVVEQVGQTQRLLFIANPSNRDQRVTIAFDTPRHLLPVWGDTSTSSRGKQLTLDLAPYTIQVWEASHD